MSENSQSSGRGSGIKDFMNSSSIIARVSFILILMLLFVVVLQFSISILTKLLTADGSPKLINGMVDGKQQLTIYQDPSISNAIQINRSVNTEGGIEFTWSIWIFINDLQYKAGTYRHIFHKGNEDMSSNGLNFPNIAPGLYLSPISNNLTLIMNTYTNTNEEITISDVPMNKWMNLIIRCRNTNLDIYVNGMITQSMQLLGVPKQNYGNVYVGLNGGFSGYISNLWYYNYALGTSAITNLVKNGPNTKMTSGSSALSMINPDYLSLRWYFYGNGDGFNPAST